MLRAGHATRRIFICADHGLALIYFLQSDVIQTLLDAGHEVILLTDDALADGVRQRFGNAGLMVEGLRLGQVQRYARETAPERQWWLNFFRRVGSSGQINTEAMDSYVNQVAAEERWQRRLAMPLARSYVAILRRSARDRRFVVDAQQAYNPQIYADLFEKYQPDLVVASTYGWRMDRYFLREAAARGIKTAVAIVGWDNPSSYGLPAVHVDHVTCWSEAQKEELTLGDDFTPEQVHIGGVPAYDGYFRRAWQMPRDEYFRLHGLDPNRKLIAYAASFVSFAPNYRNIETLAKLVASDTLAEPSQLLIRLHPSHFSDNPLYAGEREQVHQLARALPHVYVVEPVPLVSLVERQTEFAVETGSRQARPTVGPLVERQTEFAVETGSRQARPALSYYSGEDMPEKASMMAHADVFVTVYSTMVVECAIHERPIVSLCLDTPDGWNRPRKYYLPLSQIGGWPTHSRFRNAGAGRVALDEEQLRAALNLYLHDPTLDLDARRAFIARECTYTDGSAGKRTGEWLLGLLAK
jgi:hypothetical protein